MFDVSPHLVRGRPQELVVSLEGTRLGSFTLSAGTSVIQVAVPRGVATATSTLAFDFGDAVSPLSLHESDDPRPLAASFDRIAFVETSAD